MEKMAEYLKEAFGVDLNMGEFTPYVSYCETMGYIEYLTVDKLTVADRINDHLTLLWNGDHTEVIGLRLEVGDIFNGISPPPGH